MKRLIIAAAAVALALGAAPAGAQTQDAPEIPFVSVPGFLKYPPTMNLGETSRWPRTPRATSSC